MTEDDLNFLSLIGSTESTSFRELCSALGEDCPHEKSEWAKLFERIRDLERQCYLTVTKTGGLIDGIQLTESGANLIRERLDAKRGLLGLLQ